MKKLMTVILLITSLTLLLSGCADTSLNGESWVGTRVSDPKPSVLDTDTFPDRDNSRVSLYRSTWEEFLDCVNGEILARDVTDSFKRRVLNRPLTVNGCEPSSIEYRE